jgi:hypothetical protein
MYGIIFFVTSFACPKEVTWKKAKKMMLQRMGRPHPRRFFWPAYKEELAVIVFRRGR